MISDQPAYRRKHDARAPTTLSTIFNYCRFISAEDLSTHQLRGSTFKFAFLDYARSCGWNVKNTCNAADREHSKYVRRSLLHSVEYIFQKLLGYSEFHSQSERVTEGTLLLL